MSNITKRQAWDLTEGTLHEINLSPPARYTKIGKKKVKLESFFSNILSYALLNLIILLTTIISGYQVYYGAISIGALFAIQLYVSRFWTPVEFYVSFYKGYLSSKPVIESFLGFLQFPKAKCYTDPIHRLKLQEFIALDNKYESLHSPVSNEFEKGEIYAIVGENGSGKTTLVESILGLTNRFKGEIILNDDQIHHSQIVMDIAYIPGKPTILNFFDKKEIVDGSYGQQKIYQLQQAINVNKSVYIFDEPTNFLDESNISYVYEILLELKEQRKIVIIITHDSKFRKLLQTNDIFLSRERNKEKL